MNLYRPVIRYDRLARLVVVGKQRDDLQVFGRRFPVGGGIVGVKIALEVIESGKAEKTLEKLVAASNA